MITIGSINTRTTADKAYLECEISIDGKSDIIWFYTDAKYAPYLCHERSDAYVIAVLNYAMCNKHDISCKIPITEELYYNIDKYLVDALCKSNPHFYRPKIEAPIASQALPCAGAVGTGISCGVDSLHAIQNQTNSDFSGHNVTHLMYNNVGSHGEGEYAQQLYHSLLERPRAYAREYGFEFVATNSNLMDVVQQNHFYTHTYSSLFAVYCLQKLFSIYYYASSGYRYGDFTLEYCPHRGCGSYDIFSLPMLSHRTLRFYSEGAGMTRMEKLKKVADFPPAHKYLQVCAQSKNNCGKCEKCVRTLLGLDAIGKLELFSNVFDVVHYRKNRQQYLRKLYIKKVFKSKEYAEIYLYLKKDLSLASKLICIPKILFKKLLPYKLQLWILKRAGRIKD